jgi:hypothetical protein
MDAFFADIKRAGVPGLRSRKIGLFDQHEVTWHLTQGASSRDARQDFALADNEVSRGWAVDECHRRAFHDGAVWWLASLKSG